MTTASSAADSILVLGGKGKTGRRVAERLTAKGQPVRIGSRFGVPPFDWEDPTTWPGTLAGVWSVYITYQPDLAFPGAADRVGAFADMAVANGVRRLVLLSGRNEPEAQRAERLVADSGAEWTLVRSSFFSQNFSESFFADLVSRREITLPAGYVAEPFVDADDVAEIVAESLTSDRHVDRLYEVTGPRLLTMFDVAAEISEKTGRDVRYVPVTGDEFASILRAEGLPDDVAAGITDLFTQVLDGRGAYLSDGVQQALGRPPRDFADYVRETAGSGAWGAPVVTA